MKNTLTKLASILAFVIGAMAVFAGGQALLGKDPGYHVINWLLLYNYTLGVLTVAVTAGLLWVNHRWAVTAAVLTFSLHALVMLLLQTAFRSAVAMESVVAMTVRLVVWGLILGLLAARARIKG
ncbi:MAG: hypothetical protein L0Z70_16325 [Chloroflexi bacterium]|nr:hypothetical protein [Chloroflexota bacterium]